MAPRTSSAPSSSEIENLIARADAALAGLGARPGPPPDPSDPTDPARCLEIWIAALLDLNLRGVRATPVAEVLAASRVPFATAYTNLPEPVFDGVPLVGKPFTPEQVRDVLLRLARP